MLITCKDIFIIGAKRTPFCKLGGNLRGLPASQAFAAAAKDVIKSAKLYPASIDSTVVGNVHFLSQCDGGKTARYCGLYSGVPIDKPALGVNKTCGSGLQAIISGSMDILTGLSKISLTGGTEIMSALPFLVRNARFGIPLGSTHQMEDYIKTEFVDSFTGISLERMAEQLAVKFGVKRDEVDEFAVGSYLKWKAAQEKNSFQDEITSVLFTTKTKEILVDTDDVQSTTIEELGQLPAILDNGNVITNGNRAAPADGASAVLLAHKDAVKEHNLTPLARVTGWCCIGGDPRETGFGAVEAVRKLLEKERVRAQDVLFELNETFAAEALIACKQLAIDPEKLNVSGGAVAMGHPVAATGARMVTHLVHQLRKQRSQKAVAASSCGGGQGIAIMLERM